MALHWTAFSKNRKASKVRMLDGEMPLALLLMLVVVAFLLGGGSRPDIMSLLYLRPLSILLLGVGLLGLTRAHIRSTKLLFVFAASSLGLAILHLIPLPPSIWQSLPGRGLVMEIDEVAQLQGVWRPLSMDPAMTRNALWSLAVPIAALILTVQLTIEQHKRVLFCLLVFGLLSAALGLLQVLGGAQNPLYFYDVTNRGSAVGLFANRNHNAVFLGCLFGCLASWLLVSRKATQRTKRERFNLPLIGGCVLGLLLLIVILIVGSRAGMIAAIVGLLSAFGIYKFGATTTDRAVKTSPIGKVLIALMTIGGSVGAWLVYSSNRALAIDRLINQNLAEEVRVDLSAITFRLSQDYLPWGSGIGSFDKVFKIGEPDQFLSSYYANHAHNDFVEVLMTAGILGAILVAFALLWLMWAVVRTTFGAGQDVDQLALARAGIATLFILAIASIVDYPLRVPSIQVFAIIAAVWIAKYGFPDFSPRSQRVLNQISWDD